MQKQMKHRPRVYMHLCMRPDETLKVDLITGYASYMAFATSLRRQQDEQCQITKDPSAESELISKNPRNDTRPVRTLEDLIREHSEIILPRGNAPRSLAEPDKTKQQDDKKENGWMSYFE